MFELVQCSVAVLNIKKTRKVRGGLYPGGVLISGCIFLFTGKWAYNPRGAYKRQLTVSSKYTKIHTFTQNVRSIISVSRLQAM